MKYFFLTLALITAIPAFGSSESKEFVNDLKSRAFGNILYQKAFSEVDVAYAPEVIYALCKTSECKTLEFYREDFTLYISLVDSDSDEQPEYIDRSFLGEMANTPENLNTLRNNLSEKRDKMKKRKWSTRKIPNAFMEDSKKASVIKLHAYDTSYFSNAILETLEEVGSINK